MVALTQLVMMEVVDISRPVKIVQQDPDDDKILEVAVNGGATHIVTGDRRNLLPLRLFEGIAIVTPADLLRQIEHSRPL